MYLLFNSKEVQGNVSKISEQPIYVSDLKIWQEYATLLPSNFDCKLCNREKRNLRTARHDASGKSWWLHMDDFMKIKKKMVEWAFWHDLLNKIKVLRGKIKCLPCVIIEYLSFYTLATSSVNHSLILHQIKFNRFKHLFSFKWDLMMPGPALLAVILT